MKKTLFLATLFLLFASACSPTLQSILTSAKEGEAVIQQANGKLSKAMPVTEAFAQLKSNEKMHLHSGRVELVSPLNLEGLSNIELLGNKTSLVAKIDMPVITLRDVNNIKMENLTIVHEIGEWCAQNCVEFYGANNLDIRNCKFDGSGYFGLALTGVNNASIINNQFFNCEYGLAAWSCQNLTVKNNSFAKNRAEDITTIESGQFVNDVEKDNKFDKE
jgi:parallel beta-helix repeat protein